MAINKTENGIYVRSLFLFTIIFYVIICCWSSYLNSKANTYKLLYISGRSQRIKSCPCLFSVIVDVLL